MGLAITHKRRGYRVITFVAVLALIAQPLYGAITSRTAQAAAYGDIVVRQATPQGWATTNTTSGGAVNFVTDNTAPYGYGALQMTTNSTAASKARYSKSASQAKLVDVKSGLSYDTKQIAASFSAGLPSYQLEVCLSGSYLFGACLSGFTTLTYEPYVSEGNAAVQHNTWQTWNVSNGRFFSSKQVGSIQASQGTYAYTLNQITSEFPNARVTTVGVNVGSSNINYTVLTDGLRFNGVAYDFEPIAPTPPAAPANLRLNGDKACGYATNINSITPTWDAVANAVSYNYKVTLPGGGTYGPVNIGNVTNVTGPFGAEGTSTFSVQAVAASGLTSDWATPCAVTYDATASAAPIVTIDGLVSGSPTNQYTVTARWNQPSADTVRYEYKYWNNIPSSAHNGETNAWVNVLSDTQYTGVFNQGEGIHYVQVRGFDAAGNASPWSNTFVILYDTTAPTITVKNDYQGDKTAKLFSKVSFSLYDAQGVDAYTINGHVSDVTDNTWSDANFQNIKHYLVQGENVLILHDRAGNTAEYRFTYDTVAPTATFDYSNNHGNTLTQDDVTVTMTTSEPVQTPNGWVRVDATHFTRVYTANGKQQVVLTDIAGNSSSVQTLEVKRIDRTAPTISGVAPGASVRGAVTVSVFDPKYQGYDGFDRLHGLTVNGSEVSAVEGAGKTYHYTISADGTYVVAATDKAGNRTTLTFTIDNGLTITFNPLNASATPLISGGAQWNVGGPAAHQPVTIRVMRESQAVQTFAVTTDANGQWQQLVSTPLANGIYTLIATIGSYSTTLTPVTVNSEPAGSATQRSARGTTVRPLTVLANLTPSTAPLPVISNSTNDVAPDTADADSEVKAAQTQRVASTTNNETNGDVKGAETEKSSWTATLANYWWVIAAVILAGGLCWLIAARRRRSEDA